MKELIPPELAESIAFSAVRRARSWMTQQGWKSGNSIRPVYGLGYAGIKADKKYLIYQEKGTNPFVMYHLEGKTIPIKGPDGTRFVKVRGVGQPGWVTLPNGRRVWRDQKWRHPGIKPKNFMANAVAAAMKDNHASTAAFCRQLLGGNNVTNNRRSPFIG